MRLILRALLGVALLGGGMASAAVTVRVRNAADGAAAVTVSPNGVVNAAIIVESDETVTGAQVDLVASGGTGALSVVGAQSAYNAPTWDNADTALPMMDGAIGAGIGPHGTGIVTPGVLAAPGSQMSVVQIQVPSGASGTFLVNVANQLAFPDYTGGAAPDIAATADTDLTINVQASCVRTIAARQLFYAGSWYATPSTPCTNRAFGNKPAGTPCSDDTAIAVDKSALLPGQVPGMTNYSTYTKGLNGIMIDVTRDASCAALTAGDVASAFTWEKKARNMAAAVQPAGVAPTSVTVYAHPTLPNTDRIKIRFADSTALNKSWLKVTVKSEANGGVPGLAANDVFYFGLACADGMNNPGTNVIVDTNDQSGPRPPNNHSALNRAPIDDQWDYNRDSLVDTADQALPRPPLNASSLNCLQLTGVAPN